VQVRIKTLLHSRNSTEKQAPWLTGFNTAWKTIFKKNSFLSLKLLKKLFFIVLLLMTFGGSINLLSEQHAALRNDPNELLH
jgi:hypothetical protein